MEERLHNLYTLPEIEDEQESYILDLRSQCGHLEDRVRRLAASLPIHQQQLLADYIAARDELEFQSVKRALRFCRK